MSSSDVSADTVERAEAPAGVEGAETSQVVERADAPRASSKRAVWRTVGKHALAWVGTLALGALFLYGRYDWSPAVREFAVRSYASALFLFVPTLPTAYYMLRLSVARPRFVVGLTGALFVLFTLPYHWLHLDKYRSDPGAQWWSDVGPDPELKFLPKHFPAESFPHERLFFPCLLFVFAGASVLLLMHATRTPRSARAAWSMARPWVGAYAVILLLSFLHTGIRSGYTLNAFFANPAERRSWYILYLFPKTLQGAVSADFGYFWDIDKYFQGVQAIPHTLVLRRPFVHYVFSHVSAFVNPWYVYLVGNSLLWFAAAVCLYALAMRLTGRRVVAVFAAALVCVGNGFHYFVSQPKSYLAGYAVAVFAAYAFTVLHAKVGAWRWARALLCAVILGLLACTYDAQPILVGLGVLALFLRANLLRAGASIAGGFVIPAAFSRLQFNVLKLPFDRANTFIADDTMAGVMKLVTEPKRGWIYYLAVRIFSVIAEDAAYAFMILAVVLAVVGFVAAERARDRWLVIVLLAPVAILDTILVLGNVKWALWFVAEFPRLSYIAYPAVYLAGAFALERVAAKGGWRTRAAWSLVAALGLWQSADAFGFLSPSIHFYFPDNNVWLENR